MKHFTAAALLGLALLTACSKPLPEGESVIEISNAFIVKPAEGRDIAGGGMTITVKGADEALTTVSADIAKTVEIHTMSMDGGTMRMRQVDSLPVTEKAPLVLERGGNHLMFFGVDPKLAVGDTVDLVLTFSNGQGKEQMLVATAEIIGQGD
jgi:periplasmic copper chaperone A